VVFDREKELNAAELGTDQSIQADAFLGRFEGKVPVNFRRDPDHEFAAVCPSGQGRRGDLSVFPHIADNVFNDFSNALKSGFGFFGQPAQAGKLDANPDIFPIVLGPGDSVGVSIMTQFQLLSPISRLRLSSYDINIDTKFKCLKNSASSRHDE
jgi:hypothetical protein